MVLISTHTAPGRRPARSPSSPCAMASTAAPSLSIVTTTSLARATSAGLAHASTPSSSASARAACGERFQTAVSSPAPGDAPGHPRAHAAEAQEADAGAVH